MAPIDPQGNTEPPSQKKTKRKRIWVQHVAVETDRVQMRVNSIRARDQLTDAQEVVAQGVCRLADKARDAAFHVDPIPSALANWWRGTLVEAAYRNLHAARAQMIDLYNAEELRAEIPMVVARVNATLDRDDPRRVTVAELEAEAGSPDSLRPRMRRIVGDSYERLDLEHAQLRSFRNILILVGVFVTLILSAVVVIVALNPSLMPFCFDREVAAGGSPAATVVHGVNCPTSSGTLGPSSLDIIVVSILGALGGAAAATISIRNLKGTATPYDVPVTLAFLKVPLGALSAVLGLIAIQGRFVPGLSVLDSQGQILAYALVFGFGQQLLSRLLDKRAQDLLDGLPGGALSERAEPGTRKLSTPAQPATPSVLVPAPQAGTT